MPAYQLSRQAEADLRAIARYTRDTWGDDQARKYGQTLEQHFKNIAAGKSHTKSVTPKWPHLYVSRCEHHYIFFLRSSTETPVIIAVLHERMEMLRHLNKRL